MPDTLLFSGSIPANYDRYLGPYLFEPYALDLKERLQNDDCKVVLELACGTGRVTKHLLEVLSEDGMMIATDINPDMIETAKTKVRDTRLKWQVVDAQELPFEDDHFDHVVCQYGVMFFPDKPKAFKEAYRVISKGGKIVFNTWGSLKDNRRAELINEVLKDVFKDDAPDFLQKGPHGFYDTELIKQLVISAGFSNVIIESVQKIVEIESMEDLINGFLKGTPVSMFLEKQGTTRTDEVRQKLRQAYQQEFGDSLTSQMLAYVCIGEKE